MTKPSRQKSISDDMDADMKQEKPEIHAESEESTLSRTDGVFDDSISDLGGQADEIIVSFNNERTAPNNDEDQKEDHANLTKKVTKAEQDNNSLQEQLSQHQEKLASARQDLTSYGTILGNVEETVAEQGRNIAQLKERIPLASTSSENVAAPEVKLSVSESELPSGSHSLSLGPRSFASGSATGGPDKVVKQLDTASHDGTYIWKIDEFSRRLHEAVIGKTPSIYSPPFYVGRYGYKVCARVYPNGDGMGKGTHLSLFFVIMKGEYDALLPWPFRQKVTFKMLDQDRQNDVTDTFRPDPYSSSFKRPTSSMNIASGCPVFITQQSLQRQSYVCDDTIFIKIIVDTTVLPSSLGF